VPFLPPADAPEPFTWRAYAACLDLALANGYSFEPFERLAELRLGSTGRHLLLRHDIDYDPRRALALSQIERQRRVGATYFFQLNCPFYDLASRKNQDVVRVVLGMGHWLGLHFDATRLAEDERVLDEVEHAAERLEALFGVPVRAVSFHLPTHRPVRHLVLHQGRINTYSPAFGEGVEYISDSNQNWKGKDLAHLLSVERPRLLQLLIHPEWWRERRTSLRRILEEIADDTGLDVETDILTPEQRELLAGV
jgi:hypothetical protein